MIFKHVSHFFSSCLISDTVVAMEVTADMAEATVDMEVATVDTADMEVTVDTAEATVEAMVAWKWPVCEEPKE